MQVDSRELVFFRKEGPRGLARMVADNLNIDCQKVKNELRLIKDSYDERIILEARRIIKSIKGISYNE